MLENSHTQEKNKKNKGQHIKKAQSQTSDPDLSALKSLCSRKNARPRARRCRRPLDRCGDGVFRVQADRWDSQTRASKTGRSTENARRSERLRANCDAVRVRRPRERMQVESAECGSAVHQHPEGEPQTVATNARTRLLEIKENRTTNHVKQTNNFLRATRVALKSFDVTRKKKPAAS